MSRTSRKVPRKNMSALTEVCELRSLLCASVISVGAVDSLEVPMEGSEDVSAKVDATEIGSLLGAPIDPELTDIMPGDPGVDDAIFYCGVTDGDFGIPVDDASEFIRFNTLLANDDSDISSNFYFSLNPYDAVIDDEALSDGEEVAFDQSISFEDTPPIEGWDPSWLYRTLTSVEGDVSEEIIVDQGTGLEDGSGNETTPDGSTPVDMALKDFDGDGVPDEFEMYSSDPVPVEDFYYGGYYEDYYYGGSYEDSSYGGSYFEPVYGEVAVEFDTPASDLSDPPPSEDSQGEPVEVIYFGGLDCEPVDGEVAVEVDKPASDPNDEVVSLYDNLELEDVSGEPVDVVEDGELEPIRTLESSDFDPAVIFYSAAAGGVELQRTNNSDGVHEETTAATTVAIPIRPNASNSLFSADSGRQFVGIQVGLQTTSAFGTNSSPAKRSSSQRRLSTQVAATSPSVASEGLDSLTPLLGGETGSGENDSRESSVGPEEVESGLVDETVSDSGNAPSVASGFAANQNFPARNVRTAMIDRVMAQYAENSFNG